MWRKGIGRGRFSYLDYFGCTWFEDINSDFILFFSFCCSSILKLKQLSKSNSEYRWREKKTILKPWRNEMDRCVQNPLKTQSYFLWKTDQKNRKTRNTNKFLSFRFGFAVLFLYIIKYWHKNHFFAFVRSANCCIWVMLHIKCIFVTMVYGPNFSFLLASFISRCKYLLFVSYW